MAGFVLAYSHGRRDPRDRIDIFDFLAKRVASIYPTYLVSVLLGKDGRVAFGLVKGSHACGYCEVGGRRFQ